jgi:hypothetical protein
MKVQHLQDHEDSLGFGGSVGENHNAREGGWGGGERVLGWRERNEHKCCLCVPDGQTLSRVDLTSISWTLWSGEEFVWWELGVCALGKKLFLLCELLRFYVRGEIFLPNTVLGFSEGS